MAYTFDVEWRLPTVALEDQISVLHIGSFPAFASPIEELVPILGRAREQGRTTSWDPNVRPALMSNRTDAQQRFGALLPQMDLIKLSDADADYLLPGMSAESVVSLLLDHGVGLAVYTSAERGLMVADHGGRAWVPAVMVPVVDTIGAGDTVMTSLIADVVQGRVGMAGSDDLEAIGRRAVAAAAITVSRAGADLPFASELSF